MPLPRPGETIKTASGESFAIGKVLGTGGMGTVVEATHGTSGRTVALKFLHDDLLNHPTIPKRFMREVELATSLTTAHVARTFGVETAESGAPFMIMEHLEGRDLCTLLRDVGKLPPVRAAAIVSQACEALEEAHAHGIVHRDLKPENLFLTKANDGSDWVKVLDFGISKVMENPQAPQNGGGRPKLTRVGTTVGTPEYMAPEQLRGASDLDASADVYSLGVVLYEALAGARPFAAPEYGDLVRKICTEDAKPLASLRPELPPGLCDVVAKAMARDRRARVPTAKALREALTPYAIGRRSEWTVVMEPPSSVRGPVASPVPQHLSSPVPASPHVSSPVPASPHVSSPVPASPHVSSPAPAPPISSRIPISAHPSRPSGLHALNPSSPIGGSPVPSHPSPAPVVAIPPVEDTRTATTIEHDGGGSKAWIVVVIAVVAILLGAGAILLFAPSVFGL